MTTAVHSSQPVTAILGETSDSRTPPGPAIHGGAFGAAASSARNSRLTHPQKILIVRLSALGDLVFATSLLDGLLAAFPQAQVQWLVQPEFAGLLKSQPRIAKVHLWERKRWGELFRGFRWLALFGLLRGFSQALRQEDFDWVIDAQGLAKSRLLAWLAGGRRRIGYASKEPLGFLLHDLVARPADVPPFTDKPIAGEHRALVQTLTGHYGPPPRLTRPVQVAAIAGVVAIAPFTTRPQKHWPEAHWGQLIKLLIADGHRLVMLGGPADKPAAERIVALAGAPATLINQVGKTNMAEAAAQMADAVAVVGVDTGLTHMGIAFEKPTVAIFGSTVPYRAGGIAPLNVLWLGLPCSPCHRKPTCGGAFQCLSDIGPERVSASLRTLLLEARLPSSLRK